MQDNAFKYIIENEGINTEESYPYEAIDGTCKYNPESPVATAKNFVEIYIEDEDELTVAIANIGPVSVTIDSSHESFQFYSEGIYYEQQCNECYLTHSALVVGYGTDENGEDYYIVKNSWGKSWGDKGYIKMARNRNNHCGIATLATYPLV